MIDPKIPEIRVSAATRALQIPDDTLLIAVAGDQKSEQRRIILPRKAHGVDLGGRSYFLNLQNEQGERDILKLEVETADEERIALLWTVENKHVAVPGLLRIFISVLGPDFKWQSSMTELRIGGNFAANGDVVFPEGQLSALEQALGEVESARQEVSEATRKVCDAITALDGIDTDAVQKTMEAMEGAQASAQVAQQALEEIKQMGVEQKGKELEKVLIYYGYPIAINGAWSVENAVAIYKQYDMVVFGDTYSNPAHETYEDTVRICQRLKEAAPQTRIAGYVPIGLDPDWPDSNLTMAELKTRVDEWVALGMDGIFLDEFGYDYSVTRARQNEIVDYVHDAGCFVFANSWSLPYVFSNKPMTISWMEGFEPNPEGLESHLKSTDYSLFENLFYDTEKITNADGSKSVQLQCATPWRIDDAYTYYNRAQEEFGGKTYYQQYGTRIVSLDGIPSTLDVTHKNILQTISLYGAKIFNIPALAFGDENWGSGGYFHQWDLPDLNLAESDLHAVAVKTKEYVREDGEKGSFPYEWSATINGHTYSVVYDVPNPDHREWTDGMRYATCDGIVVENAWMNIYSFQSAMRETEMAAQAARTEATRAVQVAQDIKVQVDNVMPTLEDAEANIKAVVAEAKTQISEATTQLEAGLADLEALTSGFGFKEVQW